MAARIARRTADRERAAASAVALHPL